VSTLQILRIPKVQLTLFLLLIYLSALQTHNGLRYLTVFIFSVLFTIFFDLLFTFLRKKTLFIPYAALTTGVIISLTVNPSLPWYSIAFIAFIAMGIKIFLRINNRHIFNPAAAGLVIGGILLRQPVSWWAVSFPINTTAPLLTSIKYLILISPLIVSAYRMRRYLTILAFLTLYTLLIALSSHMFSVTSLAGTLIDPTVLFFAAIMLPEPMTSPFTLNRQMLYGGFVAILAVLFSFLPFTSTILRANLLPDGLLPFLLVGNLLFFRFR